MIGGIAILANGTLNVLNIFGAFEDLIYYMVHAYSFFFGVVTCISEANTEIAGSAHALVKPAQRWMHEWFKALTILCGRGLFYMFQGATTLMASSTFSFGFLVGVYMMVMGAMCVQLHFKKPESRYIKITA
eukprot:gnl/TRDRNA2_/TRDRNA2_78065_c0_seq1.p1 gnl/TRDRNA2_/TRDRNA2_78065_c0~~gnl/TRDRNA2_/TRDRNA2_78065_c0_seq1.p1  ORF type:complete len:131 (+),score=24.00 gnl/TRDRNA2_/TRDRNA2_78065_c0_seq1:3-395(+)